MLANIMVIFFNGYGVATMFANTIKEIDASELAQ